MEMFDEDYCVFDENDRSPKEESRELPPPPSPNRHPIHKRVVSEESQKQEEYKFPVEKGIMVFDTEYGHTHLLQLSYIIAYPDGNTSTPVNFYFDHPEKVDDGKEETFKIGVRECKLTKERLKKLGTSPKHEAINKFFDDMSSVDLLVAHNKSADISRIKKEIEREKEKGNDIIDSEWKPCFCTMNDQSYMKGASLKSLSEELKIDYENYYRGADGKDSVLDCKITLECFKKLCEKGYVFSPDGEYLKNLQVKDEDERPKKKSVNSKDASEVVGEIKISDDQIYTYDFTGKTFMVSGCPYAKKGEEPAVGTKEWFEKEICNRIGIKKKGKSADIEIVNIVVVGDSFKPKAPTQEKYSIVVKRQQNDSCNIIVFSEEKMREYLYSLIN